MSSFWDGYDGYPRISDLFGTKPDTDRISDWVGYPTRKNRIRIGYPVGRISADIRHPILIRLTLAAWVNLEHCI